MIRFALALVLVAAAALGQVSNPMTVTVQDDTVSLITRTNAPLTLNFGVGLAVSVTGSIASITAAGTTGGTTNPGLNGLIVCTGTGCSTTTSVTASSTVGLTLRVTGSNTYAWGALDLANASAVTGVLPVANWTPLTTEGDILFRNASTTTRLPRGTNGQCLLATASTIAWSACPTGGGNLSNTDIDTSAELATIVTDETGTGALVFANSPVLVTPNLGTPSTLTLTNATGLSLTTGVTGTLPAANGGLGMSTVTDDTIAVANGTLWQSKAVPACTDSGGNHLNYDTATNTFSCGTSSSGTSGAPTGATYLTATADGTLSAEIVIGVLDDTMIVANGTTWQAKTLPDCDDTSGQHLNYDTATNTFSCGTTGGTGGTAPSDATYLVTTANGTLSAEIAIGVTDDTMIVANGTTWQAKTLPTCTDTGGNHLNYDASTNTFSCGTSGGAGGGAPTTSQYVVLALDGTLSGERTLTAGSAIDITDAGANGNVTIDVDLTEISSLVIGSGSAAAITFNASAGTDCVLTGGDSLIQSNCPIEITGTAGPMVLTEIASPGAAGSAGQHNLYFRTSDSALCQHEFGGSEVCYGAGGGGLAATDIDTSAELNTIVTDNTGSGALVFATSPTLTEPRFIDLGYIADGSGNPMLVFDANAAPVNQFTISNTAAFNFPTLSATGTDTDIGMRFQIKGFSGYHFLASASIQATIGLYEDTDNGTNRISIAPPASVTSDRTHTLPDVADSTFVVAATSTTTTQALFATATAGAPAYRALAFGDLPTSSKTRELHFKIWGTGASNALQTTDDELSIWDNQLGGSVTITEVVCESDAGSPTIQLQRNDGSATNMLSSDLTCGTSPASTTTFVSTENVLSDTHRLDFLTVTASTAHWVAVTVVYTVGF